MTDATEDQVELLAAALTQIKNKAQQLEIKL